MIKKILKVFSYTTLIGISGISLYSCQPWADAQGWRFYTGLNPFATRAEVFSNWQTVSEQVDLKASANPRHYQRELTDLKSITYQYNGKTYTAEDYFSKAKLTGLMVLTDNKVVVENYDQGIDQATTYHLWSASKSFTATVVA
jgi:hypothetical protein